MLSIISVYEVLPPKLIKLQLNFPEVSEFEILFEMIQAFGCINKTHFPTKDL